MTSPSPRSVISIFVACATTLLLALVFTLEDRPPYITEMVVYSAVGFVASGAFTFVRLRRVPEEGFVGRTVMLGVQGGVVTLVSVALSYYALRASTLGGELFFSVLLAAVTGSIVGGVGGLLMLLVVAYALERTLFDRFDRLLFPLSLVVAILATMLALGQAGRGSRGGYDGFLLMAIAAVGLGIGIVRDRRRARWLAELPPGWSIAPFDATSDEGLPHLVTVGDDVLVQQEGPGGGPFRDTTMAHRVARFDRELVPKILVRRIAIASGAIVLMLAFTPRIVAKRAAVRTHETRLAPRHPTIVEGLANATHVVVASDYACAVVGERLRCWGNDAGERLKVPGGPQWQPVELPSVPKVERVAVGPTGLCVYPGPCLDLPSGAPDADVVLREKFVLGRTATGRVWWNGDRSQLLPDDAPERERVTSALEIEGLRDIRQIAASDSHACALDAAGDVHCWGFNGSYGTVNGRRSPAAQALPPTRVEGLPKIDRIVLGPGSSWARAGRYWLVWGAAPEELRPYDRREGSTIMMLPPSPPVRDVVVTSSYLCLLYEDGAVDCQPRQWSDDGAARMHMDHLPPGDTVEIAGSNEQLCARGSQVRCWGPYRL